MRGTWWAIVVVGLALGMPAAAKVPPAAVAPVNKPADGEKTIKIISGGRDANRIMEILIELAWLADPVTFPYFLEARVEGAAVHVRGFVPGQAVRERALKIARLQCPMTVMDNMSIREGIMVHPASIPAAQLEKAGLACLHVFFPASDCRFQLQADSDGQIRVMGQVHSLEEKLAVSQEVRRLHGCTAVVNLVHVAAPGQADRQPSSIRKPDMEADSAIGPVKPDKPKFPPPIVNKPEPAQPTKTFLDRLSLAGKHSDSPFPVGVAVGKGRPAVPPQRSKPTALKETPKPAPVAQVPEVKVAAATEEAPQPSAPLVTHGTVFVTEEPGPQSPAIQLRNHIVAACGIPEQNLRVQLKSATDLEIRIQAKDQDEANTLAQRVFQMQELLPYQVNVQVTIPR